MANKIPRLLAPAELLDIYGIPILSDIERQEYFTFNEEENKALKEFKNTKEAVYFAICLVFFKIKRTLVDFNYQNVTAERQHVMERYFPKVSSPRSHLDQHCFDFDWHERWLAGHRSSRKRLDQWSMRHSYASCVP